MTNVYFRDSHGDETPIIRNVDKAHVIEEVLRDLRARDPKFTSYYQRVFENDAGDTIIDFGSHVCFYVLREELE